MPNPAPPTVDPELFADEAELRQLCARVGEAGLRGTGSDAHERLTDWIEARLGDIPGVTTRSDLFDIIRWQPVPDGDLEQAGHLVLVGADGERREVAVAGAVPYSKPTFDDGPSATSCTCLRVSRSPALPQAGWSCGTSPTSRCRCTCSGGPRTP